MREAVPNGQCRLSDHVQWLDIMESNSGPQDPQVDCLMLIQQPALHGFFDRTLAVVVIIFHPPREREHIIPALLQIS